VPAVAAMVTGDKTAFYQCGFAGVQNTLLGDGGRHYFKRCSIQSAVDFIFVSGQSISEVYLLLQQHTGNFNQVPCLEIIGHLS